MRVLPQTEENLRRLEEDADFREEYLAMWAQSRPKPEASLGDQPASRPKLDDKVRQQALNKPRAASGPPSTSPKTEG